MVEDGEHRTAVRGKPRLQVKLVEKLVDVGNVSQAVMYAKKYYIPPQKLPEEVCHELGDYVRSYRAPTSSDIEKKFSDKEQEEKEDWDDDVSLDPSLTFSLSTGLVTREEAAVEHNIYIDLFKMYSLVKAYVRC